MMNPTNWIHASLTLAAAWTLTATVPGVALAATRTVCLEFEIRDERFACPTPGTGGAQRPATPTGTT